VWGVFVPQRAPGRVGFVVEGAAGLTGGVIIEKSSLSHYGTLVRSTNLDNIGQAGGRRESGEKMSVTQQDIDALKQEFETLVGEAESFFGRVWNAISKAAETDPSVKYAVTVSASLISDEDLETVVPSIADRLAKLVFRTIETSNRLRS